MENNNKENIYAYPRGGEGKNGGNKTLKLTE